MKITSCAAIICGMALVAMPGCKPTVSQTVIKSTGSDETIDVKTRQADDTRLLAVGAKAPDFEVEALGGETVRLSDYVSQASGPTVLLFDRAHW